MAIVDPSSRLYEKLAANVREQIDARTFRPGDRLPSVRELSRSKGMSISTVLDAYRLLEDQGFVIPRAQSGFYVRMNIRRKTEEPSPSNLQSIPIPFDRNELIEAMSAAMGRDDIVQLGFALPNPDLLPQERISRIAARLARENPESCFSYGPVPGNRGLREQIAQRIFAAGASVSPDEIVVTSGCQEALCLAIQASVPRGGLVAVESPCHSGILQAIHLSGMRSIEIATMAGAGIDLLALEEAVMQGKQTGDQISALIVCPNVQNPLGFVMPDEAKQALVDFAVDHHLQIIEDDVYGDLVFEGNRQKVLRAFPGGENVILCSSISKTLAPGLRIGWCISRNRFSEVRRLKYALSVSSPTLPQLIVSEFLSNGGYDQYLRRARKAYGASLARVSDTVIRSFPPGTRVSRPVGGFVLWVELPAGTDSSVVYSRSLAAKILIAPGNLFSAQDAYSSYLRLTTSFWSPRIEASIMAVGHICRMGGNRKTL
jgi:DNA-binding transcriptional MocR family regulator